MHAISYVRHRFPPRIIGHAVWLYLRFILSYRDVEESAGRERPGRQLRDRPPLGPEVWSGGRAEAATRAA